METISIEHFRRLRAAYTKLQPKGLNPFNVQFSQLFSIKLPPSQIGDIARKDSIITRVVKKVWFQFTEQNRIERAINTSEIVFFLAEPTHIKQNLPVLKRLREQGIKTCLLLSKGKLVSLLDNESKEKDLYVIPAEQIKRSSPGLIESMKEQARQVLEKDPVPAALQNTFLSQIPIVMALNEFWKKSLSNSDVKTIILGNDIPRDGRVIVETARIAGIRTCMIQHGNIPDDEMHSEHLVDEFFLFGEQSKSRLVTLGLSKTRLEVCGPPYLDYELKKDRGREVSKLKEFLGIKSSQPEDCILIALSGAGHRTSASHHQQTIDALAALVCEYPNLKFLIKLHRKDKISTYKEVIGSNWPENLIIRQEIPQEYSNDIFDWLELADTVITTNSSVGGEAILYGKTLISIDLIQEYKGVDYRDLNVCIAVNSKEELLNKFALLRENGPDDQLRKQSKQFIEAFYGPGQDGKSSERVVKNIQSKLPA